METEDILSNVKLLLGIDDDSKDQILMYHIKSVIRKILNYCHREDFPEQLKEVATEMVIRQYKAWDSSTSNAGGGIVSGGVSGVVSSITRGDFSISYDNSSDAQESSASALSLATDDILIDYRGQLNAYRKMVTG